MSGINPGGEQGQMATQLYIGTERGMFTVTEGRRGWERSHSVLGGKRIVALDYNHGSTNLVYIAVDNEGIYSSSDAGDSVFFRQGGDAHCVYVRRDAPKTIYAGMDRALLWASGDGGAQWHRMDTFRELWGDPEELARQNRPRGIVRAVIGQPGNRYGLFAGVDPEGLARSPDDGHLWDFVPGSPRGVRWLVGSPSNQDVIAAATDGGVVVSLDGGEVWEYRLDGLPVGPAPWVSATSAGLFTEIGGALYRTGQEVGGWHSVRAVNAAAMCTVVGDDNDRSLGTGLFYGTRDGNVYRSRDGGETWGETLSGLPPITCIAVTRD